MIWGTVAVAQVVAARAERAEQARRARAARTGALLLDLVFYVVLSLVVNSVYGVLQVAPGSVQVGPLGTFEYKSVTAVPLAWQALLALAYYLVPEAMFGASPGKGVMGLCVARVDGARLRLRDVLIRNVLRAIDWLPLLYFLGAAFVLFGAGCQRLGDLAAGTTVVHRADAASPGDTRSAGHRPRTLAGGLFIAAVLFTAGFAYFGRPPLIIQGLYNTQQLPPGRVFAYTIGTAQWGAGTVSYPVTSKGYDGTVCSGTIEFQWGWLGWSEFGSTFACQQP